MDAARSGQADETWDARRRFRRTVGLLFLVAGIAVLGWILWGHFRPTGEAGAKTFAFIELPVLLVLLVIGMHYAASAGRARRRFGR